MLRALFVSALVLFAWAHAEEPLRWPPQETAERDPSLVAFKAKLLAAIDARDADAVAALSSEHILLSFGGDGGLDSLVRGLNDDCETMCIVGGPEYWSELETAVKLGGMHAETDPSVYVTPYIFNAPSPSEQYEAYDILVALPGNVILRNAPHVFAKEVGRLRTDVLIIREWLNDDWYAVENSAGLSGFVRADDVRSPVDYRAVFEKNEDGRWLMTVFVAGD